MFEVKSDDNDDEETKKNDNIIILNKDSANDCSQIVDDPVLAVSDLLTELIQNCHTVQINEEVVTELSESSEVHRVLQRTSILNYVDINLLQSSSHATCFAINLANLLWIHASIYFGTTCNLYKKSWLYRQVQNSLIGYNVGQLGFVSLYDLHSTLMDYPEVLRLDRLKSLSVESHPQVVFVLSVPDICTPRIKVLNVENLYSDMEQMYKEYVQTYVIAIDRNLLIPLTVSWYLDKKYTDIEKNRETAVQTECTATQYNSEIDWLARLANDCSFWPKSEIVENDVYLINEVKFRIIFSFTGHEKEVLIRNSVRWRIDVCVTLWQRLGEYAMLVRSLLHVPKVRLSTEHSSWDYTNFCLNNLLLALHYFFFVIKSEQDVMSDENNERIQCLRTLASLVHSMDGVDDEDVCKAIDINREDFTNLADVISSYFLVIPTELLCQKISICRKIQLSGSKVFQPKWLSWYDVFRSDTDDTLNSLVELGLTEFAEEWSVLQSKLDPSFRSETQLEINKTASVVSSSLTYSDCIDLLRTMKNCAEFTVNAIKHLTAEELDDIVDYLVQNSFSMSNIATVVETLLCIETLSSNQKLKYRVLLVGLQMVACIPVLEQPLYMPIVYSPVLIIEQLLLAGRFSLLQPVIRKMFQRVELLPESIRESESISMSQIDELLRIYASKALLLVNIRPNSPLEHVADNECVISRSSFIPPDKPPDVKDWVANNETNCCMCCKESVFTVLCRRHHCRRCGRLVCYNCSKHRQQVESYSKPVRICDDCFEYESSERDSQSDVSSCSSLTTCCNSEETKWRLSLDEINNNAIRQQFLYENAPSVSICLSILDAHSENITIPRFLFSRCESLTKILRLHNSVDANFDYVQISSIVRSLLLAAKVYYTYLNVPSGIEQCEDLEDEVQLLNRLIQINFTGLVPGTAIRGGTELRRIRDLILERQFWSLALEISTKAGLDCSCVWFAWGKACLKDCNYEEAREKFSRSSLKKNSRLVNEIMRILCEESDDNKLSGSSSFKGSGSNYLKKLHEECVYYLTVYGNCSQLLDYYMRHNRLKSALQLILDENISPELFLEKVYIPCLKNGSIENLHQLMQEIDKSLKNWKEHIRIVCAYCERNNYLKVLYIIQLWIKDYIRAAMTSIMFCLQGAHSYYELVTNIEHLHNAYRHLESALKLTTKENELIMVMSSSEIWKHVNTIFLQIDASQMIVSNHECASIQFSSVPTLFGSSSEKTDLIVLIFRSETDVKYAFTTAHRLVTEYSLNSISVYGKVLKLFIETEREDDAVTLLKCIEERVLNCEKVKDEVIHSTFKQIKPKRMTEIMISHVTDHLIKISLYIECGLLKSAYLLSVSHNELELIKRIAEEADKLGMFSVKRICEQKLGRSK